ncbi:MAG: RluA family pseudouridine synthase [Eubacteriales bacterium]|nr:RluA family pseudouridine synthase [Eubacteriales bacterium]
MQKLTISAAEAGQRIDKFLLKYLNAASRGFVFKMLRKKNIDLNGKKADPSALLREGDQVSLWLSDETIAAFRKQEMLPARKKKTKPASGGDPYRIVYENDDIIIANKSCGILSQKADPGDISLNELLLARVRETSGKADLSLRAFTPSICNRLDRNTSGLITFAKTYPAARLLSELFADRSLHKYYLAPVLGEVRAAEHFSAWLRKDETDNRVVISREHIAGASLIETAYEPVVCSGDYTLLKILLITGKTHQIRAHLAALGHPVLGDAKYGNAAENKSLKKKYSLSHQLLHAYELHFPEKLPEPLSSLSGQCFRAEPPELFRSVLKDCFSGKIPV